MMFVRWASVAACVSIAGAFVGRGASDLVALAIPAREIDPAPALVVTSPVELAARAMSEGLFVREQAPPEPLPAPERAVACGADLRVHAIVVGFEGEGRSYASVTHAAGTAMLRPGMRIGDFEVGDIARERVTLIREEERCELSLFAPPQIAAPPIPDPQPPIAQPAANPALEGGIEQISPTHYRVERRILEYLFEHQAEVMGLARVIPQREGDRVVAVRLYGIRRNSVLGRMGLQNGDAVRSINGYEASSPDQMLRALVDLRGASRVSVAIVRRGQPTTLDYDVTD